MGFDMLFDTVYIVYYIENYLTFAQCNMDISSLWDEWKFILF